MYVLGLESSCDETAASIISDGGHKVCADVVASQDELHARYGGVVPELASRAHVNNVVPVMEKALEDAGIGLDELGGIAVTQGPGLIGALLVALQTAKAVAYARNIPIVGVHHLEGHISAIRLEEKYPSFPHLALVVSGGHTSLMRVQGPGDIVELGATRDDAAGEAFDKVAKLLGLGYPGGRVIDNLAKTGDPKAFALPRPMVKKETGLEFSFSGLKTAVLNLVREKGPFEGQRLADLCASFQATVVEVLVRKTRMAAKQEGLTQVQVCGGVAANSGLRSAMVQASHKDGFEFFVPPPARCTDNAAMIAAAGFHRLAAGEDDGYKINASSGLPLPRKRQS